MSFPTQYKAVILDCDGVVFDINREKSNAFREAVADYPEDKVSEFVKMHQATGGISRYEKFRYFFTELCPSVNTEASIQNALDRYAQIVQAAYGAIHPHPSALQLVQYCQNQCPVFIASGSDQEELRGVFQIHGITSLFAGIFGSPTPKQHNVEMILQENNLNPDEVIFVGDGGGDYQVTLELGLPFLFLGEMAEWEPSPEQIRTHPNLSMMPLWQDVLEYFHVPK